MPRNTFFLVILLAIIAAGLAAWNFQHPKQVTAPTPPTQPKPTVLPPNTYTSESCGITFQYPSTFTQAQTPDTNALFTDNLGNSIVALCQHDIPRVPLPEDKIETVPIGNVSANLYHDASQKDGAPIDKLIFTNPANGLDIYIAGYGVGFSQVISTLRLLP